MSSIEALDEHRARLTLDSDPRLTVHRGERKTRGQEGVCARLAGRMIEPAIASFEDELLFGVPAILPTHGCENDPRFAVGNRAKIANDHRVSFRLDKLQRMPGKSVGGRKPGTFPRHLRLIRGASKKRHSAPSAAIR